MGIEPFIGEVQLIGGTYAPRGWALCNGAILSIADHTALFSLIGTWYGGDGRTTFALPDLRARVAIGAGQGPGLTARQNGDIGGLPDVKISTAEMPTHTHDDSGHSAFAMMATQARATLTVPEDGAYLGSGYDEETSIDVDTYVPSGSLADVKLGGTSADVTVAVHSNGAGWSMSNQMPGLGLNYIIALEGVYPQRN